MNAFFKSNPLTFALAAVYLLVLFWTIVLKFNLTAYHAGVEGSFNWVPFPSLFGLEGQGDRNEILLNVFIFIPFGLYAGVLLKKWSWIKKAGLFFAFSLFFEVSQYVLKFGAFDSTDLVNNTLGGMLGLMIFKGMEKTFQSREKAQKALNILCLLGTIIILSFLLFLKVNHLWIFRMELLSE